MLFSDVLPHLALFGVVQDTRCRILHSLDHLSLFIIRKYSAQMKEIDNDEWKCSVSLTLDLILVSGIDNIMFVELYDFLRCTDGRR